MSNSLDLGHVLFCQTPRKPAISRYTHMCVFVYTIIPCASSAQHDAISGHEGSRGGAPAGHRPGGWPRGGNHVALGRAPQEQVNISSDLHTAASSNMQILERERIQDRNVREATMELNARIPKAIPYHQRRPQRGEMSISNSQVNQSIARLMRLAP